MNHDKNSEQVKTLKKMLLRRAGLAIVFILINLISAYYVAQRPPMGTYLCFFNIVAAVICFPTLLLSLVSLYVLEKSDGVYIEKPEVKEQIPLSEYIKDTRSRYLFFVRNIVTSGAEMCELIKREGIEIIECHLDKLRAEAVITFAALNDAKGARNILRFHDYNCTDVEEFTGGQRSGQV